MPKRAVPERGSASRFLRRPLAALLIVLTALLTACAGDFDTVGEALRLVQPTLPNAVIREPYEAQIHAVGGLRPYSFQLDSGALPGGITLQGGALRGSPTEVGQYQFSISVSDGNLSKTVQQYTLSVIETPPPTFTLTAPQTEVREAVTLRARVTGARSLTAVRMLATWDPQLFRLRQGSVSTSSRDVALLADEAAGRLQVDLALLGRVLDGDHNLFTFVLEPLTDAANLLIDQQIEFLSRSVDPTNRHFYLRQTEGRQSPPRSQGAPEDEGDTGADEPQDEPPEDVPDEPSDDDPQGRPNGASSHAFAAEQGCGRYLQAAGLPLRAGGLL